MEKFVNLKSIPSYLSLQNIDTDMIIPKQFLKTIKRTGLGKSLFYEMRYDESGNLNKDFVLNKHPYNKSKILLAGKNFGCGSSREHAPWALLDFGIRCVISSSFADIFYNNCFKNGLLPINLSKSVIDRLFQLSAQDAQLVKVCLQSRNIYVQGEEFAFNLEDDLADRIINQSDDIDISLKFADKISCFEQDRITKRPWIFYNE